MRITYDLDEVMLPLDEDLDERTLGGPKCNIFVSKDWTTNNKRAMVLIQGTGAVRAGVWARSVAINEKLDNGAIFPFIRFAKEHDMSVIVLNPNYNSDPKTKKRIINNGSMESHTKYVWHKFIEEEKGAHISPAQELYLVAHSAGGYCLSEVILTFSKYSKFLKIEGETIFSRTKAFAFTDACHEGVHRRLKPEEKKYLWDHGRHW